jgi:hypothetical protein
MKLCKDCRYAEQSKWDWTCLHPSAVNPAEVNPVTGEETAPYALSCEVMRNALFACGPEGKFWEPIEYTSKGFV